MTSLIDAEEGKTCICSDMANMKLRCGNSITEIGLGLCCDISEKQPLYGSNII